MENLYKTFTEQMLPHIQEGMTISKEYFTDLFGRYVQYLIIQDSIYVAIPLIIAGLLAVMTYKFYKVAKEKDASDYYMGALVWCILVVLCLGITAENSLNLAKTLTIPEVRIYEELRGFIKK